MEDKISDSQQKHRTNVYTCLTILTASILNFTNGTAVSWASPSLFKLQHDEENPLGYLISANDASWIGSISTLGTAIGTIPFGYVSSKLGRKPALLLTAFVFSVAFLMFAFGTAIWIFYLGRFLIGIGMGAGKTLLPSYISEISHHEDRAFLNVAGSVLLSLGVLVPYTVGPYMSILAFNLMLAVPPMLFMAIFYFWMVETPHYLVSKNRHQEAHDNLKKFRNKSPSIIATEHDALKHYIETHDEGTIFDIFKSRTLIKCLFISMFLATAQQLSAITIIITYTQEIFEAAKLSMSSDKATIIFSGIQFAFNLGPMFVLPRFRFRTLLVAGQVLLVVSLGVMGTFFFITENTDFDTSSLGFLPIACSVGVIVAFAYEIGVIPAIITTEIFPTNLRSLALSLTMTLEALEGFLLTKFYVTLADELGTGPVYWFFAACSGIAAIFVVLYVPETNGKTFQEVQEIIRKK